MTQFLPPHLLALFGARPPLEYREPAPVRHKPPYSGVSAFVDAFESRDEDADARAAVAAKPAPETAAQRRQRRRAERIAANAARVAEQMQRWDPNAPNPTHTEDPFKTLFVARINYETTEQKLRREFEAFGPVRKVRVVEDAEGRPRGYAFIEYEDDRDMRSAYKHADGRQIDGRRVLVDAERGRTVRGWLPRRLGGGRGHARLTDEEKEELRKKEEEERRRRREEEERAAVTAAPSSHSHRHSSSSHHHHHHHRHHSGSGHH